MGKEFSANAFNEKWNKSNKVNSEAGDFQKVFSKNENVKNSTFSVVPNPLFDFSSSNMTEIIDFFCGFLPNAQGEDFDEVDFANKIKKKVQKKRI